MRIVLLLVICALSSQAFAQVAIMDDQKDEHIFTLNELTYCIDPHDTLTISIAASSAFTKNFLRHTAYQNKDFQSGAAYWIRMPVQHATQSKKQWIFEFYDQTIDHLEAFIPLEG